MPLALSSHASLFSHSLAISGFCGFKHACIINGSFTNSSEWRREGEHERLLVEDRHALKSFVVVQSEV